MKIQINTDNNVRVSEAFSDKLDKVISNKLDRFSEHITRLEIYLSDINGHKPGVMDKKCIIEARPQGKPPVAVSATGNNYELAVKGATEKLNIKLSTLLSKMKTH
ncbi:MAG: HPF/RaiA family ribosome-associated protein [Bacteroidetes bacterium]|mgnify:CR=1 FL=1|nr:HPF/RaiA family ribosome-associated protein [Bacteroidota bacterium]